MHRRRVVALGGGTGLSVLLRGLRDDPDLEVTAVVAMTDDGGSSGRLRREFGVLPTGDVRSCLAALSKREDLLGRLLAYRFPVRSSAPEVGGHSFGNLMLTALADILGGVDRAVSAVSEILSVNGRVLPVTMQQAHLVAELEDGRLVRGESSITRLRAPIRRVRLSPPGVRRNPEAAAAIRRADMLVFGPGSLYTSVLPHLAIRDSVFAAGRTSATVVYVCNIMTEPGETTGYSVDDHVRCLREHAGPNFRLDAVVVNTGSLPSRLVRRYRRQGSFPVANDVRRTIAEGVRVVRADLCARDGAGAFVRHDPARLGRVIRRLL
jgi:uncharacterized cofD-like protein